jgi:hypothetical protein
MTMPDEARNAPMPELYSLGYVLCLLRITPSELRRLQRLAGVSAELCINDIPHFSGESVRSLAENRGLLAGPRCRTPGDD